MTEYWIWSNDDGAWWAVPGKDGGPLADTLHEAGRFHVSIAVELVAEANADDDPIGYPSVVLVPVTNDYMPVRARRILEAIDRREAEKRYLAIADQVYLDREALVESLGQMARGEGGEITPGDLGSDDVDQNGNP